MVYGNGETDKGKILIVDDVEINRIVLGEIINNMGYSPVLAENGEMALELLKEGYPQLVLTDISMPGMNGYDATRAIRELNQGKWARIPIIAMTANAFEEDKQEAIKSGMNGHIAKPIDIDHLFETLDKMLCQR